MSIKTKVCPICGETFTIPNVHMIRCPSQKVETIVEFVKPGFCENCGDYTVFHFNGVCTICGKSG